MRPHFTASRKPPTRGILIYNIPYRTWVNLANDTLLRLAELPNIVGVKDCSGNLAQSLDLLQHRPGFSVLTGEDASLFAMLASGGDGGIRASTPCDRPLRRHVRRIGRTISTRPARSGHPSVSAPETLSGGQPHADQARALAPGPHRLSGVSAPADPVSRDLRTSSKWPCAPTYPVRTEVPYATRGH